MSDETKQEVEIYFQGKIVEDTIYIDKASPDSYNWGEVKLVAKIIETNNGEEK